MHAKSPIQKKETKAKIKVSKDKCKALHLVSENCAKQNAEILIGKLSV